LTGDAGGAVSPDAAGNTDLTGGAFVTVTGTPGTNSLEITLAGAIAGSFPTDAGIATPAANTLTVAGGTNINTSGAGSTVTINLDGTITLTRVNATTFDTNIVAAGLEITGTTISADGTDPNIDINISAKGAGQVIINDLNLTTPLAIAYGGTNANTMATTYGVNYFDGTRIVTTTAGTATQVLTSNGAGVAPTFQIIPKQFTWNSVAGTTQAMAVDNGYITVNAALTTCTLPDIAAIGSIIRVTGIGATGWKIAQNAGETIYFGSGNTTTGVTGYLQSTATRDSVELVCVVANTDWNVLSSLGNITVS